MVSHNALHLGQWEQCNIRFVFIGGGPSEAVLVRGGCAHLRARACSELSRRVSLFGDVLNPDAFMRKTCLSRCITAVAMATAKKNKALFLKIRALKLNLASSDPL